MRKGKILFTDLDGTLLSEDQSVSEARAFGGKMDCCGNRKTVGERDTTDGTPGADCPGLLYDSF